MDMIFITPLFDATHQKKKGHSSFLLKQQGGEYEPSITGSLSRGK